MLPSSPRLRLRLVGADPTHDLAVLAIDVPGDPPAALPIGSSADLKVGQSVFAIGNPFGLDWTLTQGIVSALDRELAVGEGRVIRGLIHVRRDPHGLPPWHPGLR